MQVFTVTFLDNSERETTELLNVYKIVKYTTFYITYHPNGDTNNFDLSKFELVKVETP